MAEVKMTLNPEDKPTKEQIEELKTAAKKPIVFTEDAPELTDEELAQFKPVNPRNHRTDIR